MIGPHAACCLAIRYHGLSSLNVFFFCDECPTTNRFQIHKFGPILTYIYAISSVLLSSFVQTEKIECTNAPKMIRKKIKSSHDSHRDHWSHFYIHTSYEMHHFSILYAPIIFHNAFKSNLCIYLSHVCDVRVCVYAFGFVLEFAFHSQVLLCKQFCIEKSVHNLWPFFCYVPRCIATTI